MNKIIFFYIIYMPVKRSPRRKRWRRKKKYTPRVQKFTPATCDYHKFRLTLATQLVSEPAEAGVGVVGLIRAYWNMYSLTNCYKAQTSTSSFESLSEAVSYFKPLFDVYRVARIRISHVPDYNLGILDNSGVLPGAYICMDVDNQGFPSNDPNKFMVRSNSRFVDLKRRWTVNFYPPRAVRGTSPGSNGWMNLQEEGTNTYGNIGILSTGQLLSTTGNPVPSKVTGSIKVEYFIEFKNRKQS